MFLDMLFEAILMAEVQVGLAALLALLLTGLVLRYRWVMPVVDMAHSAYEFAEDKGYLDDLKGYQKVKPFFEKLDELYEAKFATRPTPAAKARAVRVMEQRVLDEHKPGTPKAISKRRPATFMLIFLVCWMAVLAVPPEPVLAGEWYGTQTVTYFSNRDSRYVANLGYKFTADWNLDLYFNWDVGQRTSWDISTTFHVPFSHHLKTVFGVNLARDGTHNYVSMTYLL